MAEPASQPTSGKRFVAGLDHLRGLAALLVVFHHSFWMGVGMRDPTQHFHLGWPRVDNPLFAPLLETHFTLALFFVLSGFVLTLGTYRRDFRFGGYMRNRCLRVLPVLLTVLLLGVAVFPKAFTLSSFLASATFFGNVQGAALDMAPITTALWTVAVEFQFYLILPMLIAILGRQGTRPIVYLMVLMLALRAVGFFLLTDPDAHDVFGMNYWFLVPGRLDQFLMGMLAARFYLRWKADPRTREEGEGGFGGAHTRLAGLLERRSGLAFGLALVAVFVWTNSLNALGSVGEHAWWHILVPTGEGLVCVGLILSYPAFVTRVPALVSRGLSFVGERSYSIYVCHFMVVALIAGDPTNFMAMPGHNIDFMGRWGLSVEAHSALNTLLLSFPAVIALAHLFHEGVERPFMKLRRAY